MLPPDPDEPAGPQPDARKAVASLRAGIARARLIVREAKQAIGRRATDGPLLADTQPEREEDARLRADTPSEG